MMATGSATGGIQGSEKEANASFDFELLSEEDIPGASLNGKTPGELNVVQLKRWLACRGAPTSGKKPELIERVESYIKYGWDQYLTDPDGGVNCKLKLTSIHKPGSEPHRLLQCLPSDDDAQWTKQLLSLPTITFSTIYDFLVSRKVLLKKVRHIENAADTEDRILSENSENSQHDDSWYESVEYTRTLDKAYRFFKDGHVQTIKYHPWTTQPDIICVKAAVLPSMRKDRIYHVKIVFRESSVHVITAFCTCPAGLSGCCNHITATLYSLEDYVHLGLREQEKLGCTEKLQNWNNPRKKHVEPRPTDDVKPHKAVYGKEIRCKLQHINNWDCRPESRRIIDPNKARKLRENLSIIEQNSISKLEVDICAATSAKARKLSYEKKCMLLSYGTSCFLQILDEEPAPLDHESRQEELRKERIARAQEKRQLFLQQLAFKQYCLKHDHSYSCTSDKFSPAEQHKEIEYKSQVILNDLYIHHVSIDSSTILELEATTRGQSKSEKWVFERKLRITASVMKQVCHHRPSTSCDSFVKRKLSSSPISVPAIEYGRKNEQLAISSYLNYHKANGKIIQVESCGLFVDHRKSWLAASPDAVVTDFSDVDNLRGCLEVKCPHVCESRSIKDACREVKGFCLTDSKGLVQLCRSHMYYYQVQTQMQVTGLRWCDFFIWSPVAEPFVERIAYDETFMDEALQKAEAFYFNKFLPSIASYLIIQPSSCDIVMSKSVLCCRTRTMGTDNSHDYNTETMIAEKAVDGSNSAGNMTMKLCSAKGDIKPDSVCNPCITLDGTSVAEPKSDFMDRTENIVSIPKKQDISMECQNTEKCYEKDPNRKEVKPRATTEVKPGTASADLQLMTVYSKPLMCVNNLQALLKHLGLKKHSVKADGNCLYHAVAHQAELITKCSTGDELVSRHLRHLVFLTMVTYSNVRLETSMSPTEWLEKQKQVLTPEKWGGDFELRLMAIGLKRDIIVITDSTTGSAFGHRFPKEPPPVEKMKGGVFVPLTLQDLYTSKNGFSQNSLYVIYNDHNHYDSTVHVNYKTAV